MENFVIENGSPLNMSDIERVLASHNAALLADFEARMACMFKSRSCEGETNTSADVDILAESVSDSYFITFLYRGKLGSYVPEDFTFPSLSVKTVWDLYFFGNSALRIRPLRFLTLNRHQQDLRTETEKGEVLK